MLRYYIVTGPVIYGQFNCYGTNAGVYYLEISIVTEYYGLRACYVANSIAITVFCSQFYRYFDAFKRIQSLRKSLLIYISLFL